MMCDAFQKQPESSRLPDRAASPGSRSLRRFPALTLNCGTPSHRPISTRRGLFQLLAEIIAPACGQGFDLHRTAQQVMILALADVEPGNVGHRDACRIAADEFNGIVCADIALFDDGEVKACAQT